VRYSHTISRRSSLFWLCALNAVVKRNILLDSGRFCIVTELIFITCPTSSEFRPSSVRDIPRSMPPERMKIRYRQTHTAECHSLLLRCCWCCCCCCYYGYAQLHPHLSPHEIPNPSINASWYRQPSVLVLAATLLTQQSFISGITTLLMQ